MSEQQDTILALIEKIKKLAPEKLRLMEVCGTHTTAIARYGLRPLLWPAVELVSGPGCPVCVTDQSDLDQMVALATLPEVTLVTFGDMLRVPGSQSTLEMEKAAGADIRAVYSPLEAVKMAAAERRRQFIFLGVGFETTAPAVALSLELAREKKLDNYFVFSCLKLLPPALHALLGSSKSTLRGLILPGHVSVVIGRAAQDFVSARYAMPAAITGFEFSDILYAIFKLVEMAANGQAEVINCYPRVVQEEGNRLAVALSERVFQPTVASWRGLGVIGESGLTLRPAWAAFDARLRFPVTVSVQEKQSRCRCSCVLLGEITPPECDLFGHSCNPLRPEGPCMVSSEGACAAYYRFEWKRPVKQL